MKRHIDCRQRWLGFLIIFSFLAIQLVTPADSPCQSSNLTIGNYVKVSEKRISRTVYEYSYHANITNSGLGVQNVVATFVSNSPYTTILDNTLSFGDVPAGATLSSSDTFTIRHDRLYPFSWSNLDWQIGAQEVQVIGSEGGIISVQNHLGDIVTLEIPLLALTDSTPISITALATPPPNPFATNIYPGIILEPSGLIFSTPSQLQNSTSEGS